MGSSEVGGAGGRIAEGAMIAKVQTVSRDTKGKSQLDDVNIQTE